MMLYAMLSCDMCDINKITLRGVPFFFWQCVVKFEGFFFSLLVSIFVRFLLLLHLVRTGIRPVLKRSPNSGLLSQFCHA